jgi:hypothetical protein
MVSEKVLGFRFFSRKFFPKVTHRQGLGLSSKERRRSRPRLFLSIQMSIIARHLEEEPRSHSDQKERDGPQIIRM